MMKQNIHDVVCGLYAIIDTHYVSLPDAADVTGLILDNGCRLVQLRAKGAPNDAILTAAVAMRKVTAATGAVFIVNDDIDIAVASKADGVHIGQTDTAITDARLRLGKSAIIGVSTHNIKEAIEAETAGADYISFGPIWATRTKLDADRPKGLAALAELRRHLNLPIAAIGGITEENAAEALRHGANAVAIISDVLLAKDIGLKVAALVRVIGR